MSTPQPTLTAAIGGRLSGRPLHSRIFESFTRLEAGEGRSLLLFFAYAFLVLVSYYIVRTLREPLLLVDASAEVKTYASAAAALALLLLVPFTGRHSAARTGTSSFAGSPGSSLRRSARSFSPSAGAPISASSITSGPGYS